MAKISILDVHKIRVSANCGLLDDGGMCHWQALVFLDEQGRELGEVVLYLDGPDAALPVGDQPPYWGADAGMPVAADGPAPF